MLYFGLLSFKNYNFSKGKEFFLNPTMCYLIVDIWKRTLFLSLFLELPLYFQKTKCTNVFLLQLMEHSSKVLMQKWLIIGIFNTFKFQNIFQFPLESLIGLQINFLKFVNQLLVSMGHNFELGPQTTVLC